jgi:hypothetical protein
MQCTPKQTITFNDFGWDEGMTYKQGKRYKYEELDNSYKVYLGNGYLWFEADEFKLYFNVA